MDASMSRLSGTVKSCSKWVGVPCRRDFVSPRTNDDRRRRASFSLLSFRVAALAGLILTSSLVAVGTFSSPAGASTSAVEAPLPINALNNEIHNENPTAIVTGVSCPTISWCVAVGNYVTSTAANGVTDNGTAGNEAPFIDTYSSGTWTASEPVLPTNANTDPAYFFGGLSGVSCWAIGACVAVGTYSLTEGVGTSAWADTLSSGTWNAAEIPALPGSTVDTFNADGNGSPLLFGVDCPTAGSCMAVGEVRVPHSGGNAYEGLAETLASTTWTGAVVVEPLNADLTVSAGLKGVSCASSVMTCTAVGQYAHTSGGGVYEGDYGWIASLASGAWSATEAPMPANANTAFDNQIAFLNSVSCPSSGGCVAVGTYVGPNSSEHIGMIDTLPPSSSTWSSTAAAFPSDFSTLNASGDGYLEGVSCTSVSTTATCVADGWYVQREAGTSGDYPTIGLTNTIIETAGTWGAPTAGTLPAPSNAGTVSSAGVTYSYPAEDLYAIACVGASECVAGGRYDDTNITSASGACPQGCQNGVLISMSPSPTTTTPSVSTSPVSFGDTVTYSAIVTAASGTPTGTVFFSDGATMLCTTPDLAVVGGLDEASCSATNAPVGVGDPITATYSGDSNYSTSSGATTLSVGLAAQSAAFYTNVDLGTSLTSDTVSYSLGTYWLYAKGSANGPITFASSTPGVCTVDSTSGLVTLVTGGTCDLTADAGSIGNYADSGPAPFTLTISGPAVNTLAPAITGTTAVGDTLATASGNWSSDTASFTYQWYSCTDSPVANPSADGTCTTVGTGVDTYTLVAGDSGNYVGVDVTDVGTDTTTTTMYSNVVGPVTGASPSVTFTNGSTGASATDTMVYNAAYSANATDTGGGVITYTAVGCIVDANSGAVSATSAGTLCVVTAHDPANGNYAAGTATLTITVTQATPSAPSISNPPANGQRVGGGFTATVTTTGDGVTSVTSNNTSVCTASGLAVIYLGVGTCSLSAHVATGTNYTSAHGTAQTFSVSAAITWSSPASIDVNSLTAVSCVSRTFCMAVDLFGGALRYNGTTWSARASIDGINTLSSVSCVSSTFCMAVDARGNALRYDGTTWSSPALIDDIAALSSVSCVSSTFCVAVDDVGYELSYDGVSWSAPTNIDFNGLTSVSCVSSTFCMAVDDAGYALIGDASAWSFPGSVAPPLGTHHPLYSVSCASNTFCVAVDDAGNAGSYSGLGWTAPAPIGLAYPLSSVSCVSSTFCMAMARFGDAPSYDGTTWSSPTSIDGTTDLIAVSCVSSTFCVAVDDAGNALSYSGTTATQLVITGNTCGSLLATSASCTLIATLEDASGSPVVDGSAVTFAQGGTDTGAVTGLSSVTNNGDGTYTVTVTGSTVGTVSISAADSTDSIAASNNTATFTFSLATQATLRVSNATTGTAGTGITLTTTGGSGTGAVTYSVTGTGCAVSGSSLSASGADRCVVTAAKAASGIYGAATSVTKTFTFSLVAQPTLSVSNATLSGSAGAAIRLTTSGGSELGVVSFRASGTGCSVSGYYLSARGADTCTVTAHETASGIYAAASSLAVTFTFSVAAQNTLSISNATTTGTAGTAITLTTTGGSGTGAVTYSVTGTGCSVLGSSLSASGVDSCVVTATRAASGIYAAASSTATTFTFSLAAQATLRVSNVTTSGSAGTAITLTNSGGSGTGAVTFSVTGTGCSVSGSSLSASGADSCVVTAHEAASGIYSAATSATKTFTFSLAAQTTLSISNATTTGTAGTGITLTTTGGSGTGALSFRASGTGCAVSGSYLSASGAETCTVTAHETASGIYSSARSLAVTFTFSLGAQAPLSISNVTTTGTVGTGITLTTSGGSGTGAVTFSVAGTRCAVSGSSLSASSAGTCVVTAAKAARSIYSAASSLPITFTFL